MEVEKELNELQSLCKLRESRLSESRKLFRFFREAEEVAEWINDQTAIAASEDYGRDVEHVELLIQVSFLSYLRPLKRPSIFHFSSLFSRPLIIFSVA